MLATTPRLSTFLDKFPRPAPRGELPLLWRDTRGKRDPRYGYSVLSEILRTRSAAEAAVLGEGYLADDPRTKRLTWSLRRMGYDDALLCGEWRVELLYLDTGMPHFRLYYRSTVVGIVALAASHADLSTCRLLDTVRQYLAAYLVGWGWCPASVTLERFGAKTSYAANVDRQYRLFDSVATPRKSAALYDVLSERELEGVGVNTKGTLKAALARAALTSEEDKLLSVLSDALSEEGFESAIPVQRNPKARIKHLRPHYTNERFKTPQTVYLAKGYTLTDNDCVKGAAYNYSDRYRSWFSNEAWEAAWNAARAVDTEVSTAAAIEAFLRSIHTDSDLKLVHIMAGFNVSSGHDYQVYGFIETKAK